jgi:uncharacterized protein (TIGR00730 family)
VDDLKMPEAWRILRIQSELVDGIEKLVKLQGAVTVFGSARIREDDPYYDEAVKVGKLLARENLAVITGGGPGLMEAANRGAFDEQGKSVGLNITLPAEQKPNKYHDISLNFRYFFVRKFMFVKHAVGFVILPGGFGTLDELFEALTLVQTGKAESFPIVLLGKTYWQDLIGWLTEKVMATGCIDEGDLAHISLVDTAEEAVALIRDYREKCPPIEVSKL